MCGRYAFFSPAEAVKRVFALDAVPELEPRYNVAPTQSVAAVRAAEGRVYGPPPHSGSYGHVDIPPGHMPPPGECRI